MVRIYPAISTHPCPSFMPKVVDRIQYRAELLDRCFPLFAEWGYAAITMRQIAQGLGVSTGTLYHYFEGKQEIFEQMVLARIESDFRELSDQLLALGTVQERVEAVFDYFHHAQDEMFRELSLYLEYYHYTQTIGQASNNILHEVFERLEPEIETVIGIRNKTAGQLLFSSIDGLMIARIYGCNVDWTAQGKLLGRLLSHVDE